MIIVRRMQKMQTISRRMWN